MPVFDRGDVVSVPLDPAIGHEQRGTRPALVKGLRGCVFLELLRAVRVELTRETVQYAWRPDPPRTAPWTSVCTAR